MNYYSISTSLNKKITGYLPQTKEIIYNCDVINEPKFIDLHFFREITINPILANLSLYKSTKLTDLISSNGGMGFTFGSMIISDKLKKIFEQFNIYCLQYFPTFVMQNNERIDGYWQTHISKQGFELLDFKKIRFVFKEIIDSKVHYKDIDFIKSLEDFLKCKEKSEWPIELYFFDLILKKDVKYDYFYIPHFINGNGYGIVSENLKNEIEKNGITGIEFRPIELSLQDWFHSEQREKIYGKI
jgi:hypothetical protein